MEKKKRPRNSYCSRLLLSWTCAKRSSIPQNRRKAGGSAKKLMLERQKAKRQESKIRCGMQLTDTFLPDQDTLVTNFSCLLLDVSLPLSEFLYQAALLIIALPHHHQFLILFGNLESCTLLAVRFLFLFAMGTEGLVMFYRSSKKQGNNISQLHVKFRNLCKVFSKLLIMLRTSRKDRSETSKRFFRSAKQNINSISILKHSNIISIIFTYLLLYLSIYFVYFNYINATSLPGASWASVFRRVQSTSFASKAAFSASSSFSFSRRLCSFSLLFVNCPKNCSSSLKSHEISKKKMI